MPTPTVIHSFGESSSTSDVFCLLELDSETNLDSVGEEKTSFLPGEVCNLLLHVEPGATIESLLVSYGDITNLYSPTEVTRFNEIESVSFETTDSEYELPHYPSGAVSVTWDGNTGIITKSGRKLKCSNAPRIGKVSYNYSAYQFSLQIPDFELEDEQTFNILVVGEVI